MKLQGLDQELNAILTGKLTREQIIKGEMNGIGYDLVLSTPIKRGGQAAVSQVRNRKTGELCALKWYVPDIDPKSVTREVEILEKCSGSGILALRASRTFTVAGKEHSYIIVAPWCPLDLRTQLGVWHAKPPANRQEPSLRWILEIAYALQRLQSNGFSHLDIKPENILLHDAPYLADFGIARRNASTSRSSQKKYTPGYDAPEILQGILEEKKDREKKKQEKKKNFYPQTDVWSLAVVLHECLTGERPTQASRRYWRRTVNVNLSPDLPSELKPLIEKALQPDYRKRCSLEDFIRELEVFVPPVDWDAALWKECWVPQDGILDFTTSQTWAGLGAAKQGALSKAYQTWYARKRGLPVEKTVSAGGASFEMMLIPPGKFWMGSPESEKDRYGDEGPRHKVLISKPFYLGKTEVTQAQWQKIMGSNPSNFKGDRRPVEQVSWKDCQEFCKKTGLALPSEAQWEFACRAGSTGAYCFGDDGSLLKDYAWYNENSGSKTHPVGQKKPNALGLYDMHGNVREWCGDRFEKYPSEEVKDPTGPSNGSLRVLRGGSWSIDARWLRSAVRCRIVAEGRYIILGARLVSEAH
jgi:formylglycine-generating enzyme required for sulfatase activity